jgi:hypothetical protein
LEQAANEIVKEVRAATREFEEAAERVQTQAGSFLAQRVRDYVSVLRQEAVTSIGWRGTTVGSSPWHGNAVDATSGALDARGAGVKKGLMLEEVQVAPCEGLGVIGLRRGGAEGTSETGAARKVQIEVEPSGLHGESAAVNQPRWEQPQGRLKQFVFVHVV